jgi:thiamine biosynthesis lipoprotein
MEIKEIVNESLHHYRFKAMNTNIEIIFESREKDINHMQSFAFQWFANVEARFSRFKAESELNHLNRLAGESCMVSNTMLEVIHLAEMYRQMTDGLYDPLILNALIQVGYEESFECLKDKRIIIDSGNTTSNSGQRNQIKINNSMKSIQLPEQVKMDLSGIVKSWAVQRLANHYKNKLNVTRGIINAGGDLTVWGNSNEQTNPWIIGIEQPWQENEEIGQLLLFDGSVATSSKLGRNWSTQQGQMHHIIDPRTMLPSQSDVVQCTVTGKNAVECEIWAKVICILGCKDGLTMLADKTDSYEAILVTSQRETHFYGKKASLAIHSLDGVIDHYHYSGGHSND